MAVLPKSNRRLNFLLPGLLVASAGAIVGGLAIAQDAPESLLPPGFDDPAPAPSPTSAPASPPPSAAPVPAPAPAVAPPDPAGGVAPGSAPGAVPGPFVPPAELSEEELSQVPSLEELEDLSTDQLDDLLGLKPKFDIPPAARRSLSQVGLLSPSEGGMPVQSLARQPPRLVRAALAGTSGPLVSRWGHILLRKTLASRLAAPLGMDPVEFAALRAGVLNSIGEYAAARALVQDVDTGNWNSALGDEAMTAFVGTADIVGICPLIRLRGVPEETEAEQARWVMLSAICNAYAGESARAVSQLDGALNDEIAPAIDVLLARRYAGAAGRAQRGVAIEWDGVEALNPWRFALANAVGERIPEALLQDVPAYYQRAGATMAMAPLGERADYAARAASEGILSARAMVDLYSAVYANEGVSGEPNERARQLRTAYIAQDPSARIAAMESLWLADQNGDYGAHVLTAYAAARIVPAEAFAANADELIASMLMAGLDRDAAAWAPIVADGSKGWALLALSTAQYGEVTQSALDTFVDNDASEEQRRSGFLVAGLAGLGRIDANDLSAFENRLSLNLAKTSRWTQVIEQAGELRNPGLTAMIVGLGMQGDSWSQMTPLHLYHIVRSLTRAGLEAEARMIAAEAVARG